tara:strand:+ start:5675 stop:11950 length:6276 start_codon:yes stop_codon:yes gene_type:complete
MPELNRSFIKGKMNKDLDERLLPPNEYRDAMNITVSSSESSDVGAIENLNSTKFLDSSGFQKPLNNARVTTGQLGGQNIICRFENVNFLYPGIKNTGSDLGYLFQPAQVVGAKEDTTTNRIYYFVANAAGFEASTSFDGNTIYTGVKSDSILECTPNKLNYRFPNRSILPVFTDAYEVRLAPDSFTGTGLTGGNNPDGSTKSNALAVNINGIEEGMTVSALSSNRQPLRPNDFDGVVVTNVTITNFNNETTNKLSLTFNKSITLSAAEVNEGAVLVFRKPRILNFISGIGNNYTDANGDTITSPTPKGIITAIDVFDGMLFFTDGRNEPKKINIERCLKGTINIFPVDNFGGIFSTTRLRIPTRPKSTLTSGAGWNSALNNTTRAKPMTEKHLTVIRPAPTLPPKLYMSSSTRPSAAGFAATTSVATSNINLSGDGLNPTVSNEVTILTTATHGFVIGDQVNVLHTSDESGGTENGIRGLVTEVTAGIGIKVRVSSIVGTNANASAAHNIDLITDSDQILFKDQFVRFAYRYTYPDGEVSSLSPFSQPAFLPGNYSYDAKEAFNKGMENTLRYLVIHDFAPGNMPLDAVGIDILYKEDISPNIYFVRNIKGCKLFTQGSTSNPFLPADPEFNANGFISPDLFNSGSYSDWVSFGTGISPAVGGNRGAIVMQAEQFGSTIPSNQLLRSYDNVPKTAKAQAISANRLIYANYTQAYDLIQSSSSNSPAVRPKINLKVRNLSAITSPTPESSIKSQRTYQAGVVYKGPHGRETSVLIDKETSVTSSINLSDQKLRLAVNIENSPPIWATHYKVYVKETSNEYYNLAMHRSYSMGETEGDTETPNEDYVILAFQSVDRNKIQEGDFLSIKKGRAANAVNYKAVDNKIKVLDIFNEAPQGMTPAASAQDKEGKFFVKVKNIAGLLTGSGGEILSSGTSGISGPFDADVHTGTNVNEYPAVFEVLPSPDRDVNLYYEATQCYPIELTEDTICEWVNPGDKVIGFDYVSGASGSVGLAAKRLDNDAAANAYVDTITPPFTGTNNNDAWMLTFKDEAGNAVAFDFQNNSYLGTLHFQKELGSFNISSIFFGHNANGYNTTGGGSSGNTNGANNNKVYIKKRTVEPSEIVLPWFNCYSFGNGVESDRIRDDFNAATIANGVKASTTFEDYKEEKREHSFIFSGIFNATSGVNELNQFIQAEPITKDLNPLYGSIQRLISRDTDIVALCEDKILKVLANKNALFNADGNTNVTSNTQVLGTAIPFNGEYGVSTNPESVVQSGYRVYFTDKNRGAVLRLSMDGLTPISDYGMSDYFKDTLRDAETCIGSYNGRLDEYDLSIHSIATTAGIKTVDTIAFNEKVNGWSSFRSYAFEQGLSLDGQYYTFKYGNIYEHSLENIKNHFYGIVSTRTSNSGVNSTVKSPINPNIQVGDVIFSSNASDGNINESDGLFPNNTIITAINGNQITTSTQPAIISGGTTTTGSLIVTQGTFSNSTVTTIFNDAPNSVKSFQYLKYEGSQAKIIMPNVVTIEAGSGTSTSSDTIVIGLSGGLPIHGSAGAVAVGQNVSLADGTFIGTVKSIDGTTVVLTSNAAATVGLGVTLLFSDNLYYNNRAQNGWFASSVETDMQSAKVLEFIKKEGKWFNYFKGVTSSFTNQNNISDAIGNIDSQEFSVQGIGRVNGVPSVADGDTTPGSLFNIQLKTDEAIDNAPTPNVYTVSEDILIQGVTSVANSNDSSTGTITFTPAQSPTTFLTISPAINQGIAASEFFVRGGTSGDTSDAASGTTFTHGTNGINLNSSNSDKPLDSIVFTDTGTPFAPGNTVKMSFVFEDTTYTADRVYEIPIKRFTNEVEIPQSPLFRSNHFVEVQIRANSGGDSTLTFPFIKSTALVFGPVTSDATVVIDESPVGTPVTSDTLGNFSAGDLVTGTNVDSGQSVDSITNATTFELSSADSILNDTTLTISGFISSDIYSFVSTQNDLQTNIGSDERGVGCVLVGQPFATQPNTIVTLQLSAGTNKKFTTSFVNNSGFGDVYIENTGFPEFNDDLEVTQEFINDASGNAITLRIRIKINPQSNFEDFLQTGLSTKIVIGGKTGTEDGLVTDIS